MDLMYLNEQLIGSLKKSTVSVPFPLKFRSLERIPYILKTKKRAIGQVVRRLLPYL